MSEPDTAFDLAHPNTSLARVVFGDSHDPLVELSIDQSTDTALGRRIELDAGQRAAVSALLAQVPGLLQSTHTALSQTYRLSFAPEVASKMASIMQANGGGLRAAALNGQGKIIGQGILTPANGVRALAATTAVWQVMAIITAQVYLADINKRLANIERGIDEIRRMLETEQISKLKAGLSGVREAAIALAQHDLREAERDRYAGQLDQIWRDCDAVARTLLALLGHEATEFAALPLNAWHKLGESAGLAQAAIATFDRRAQAYLLAEYVRCMTIALRAPLGLHAVATEHRLAELRDSLGTWKQLVEIFFHLVDERVRRDVSATFSRQAAVDQQRRLLLDQANEVAQRLIAIGIEIEELRVRTKGQTQRSGAAQPLVLIVTLDQHGQIAQTYQAPMSAREPALNATRGMA